jgi:hypothetical protein
LVITPQAFAALSNRCETTVYVCFCFKAVGSIARGITRTAAAARKFSRARARLYIRFWR